MGAATDWFGNPIGEDGGPPQDPVACPYCSGSYTRRSDLAAHLADAHGHGSMDARVRPARRAPSQWARFRRWFEGLRFLPLWFVLPLNLLLAALVWMSVRDPLFNPAAAHLVRLSLLPSILLLAARIAGRKP